MKNILTALMLLQAFVVAFAQESELEPIIYLGSMKFRGP